MQKKRERFVVHDDVFDKLQLEYEYCDYCIIDNVRLYKYWNEYRVVSEEYFEKKRNSMFLIGIIYTCNELQSVKAKIALEAYYGITRYNAIETEVTFIDFTDTKALENGIYEVGGKIKATLYVPNEKETELIIKNKHRRVKAHGLRRIFK